MDAARPLVRRRFLIAAGAGWTVSAAALAGVARAMQAPPTGPVAGIALPDSPLARAAIGLARADCPDFLFNHSIRTFLFGALFVKARGASFDAEEVFVAAALHDLGLLPKYASPAEPFEIDSAEAAKALLQARGVAAARIDLIWDAIAMHASAIGRHKPLEVRMVGAGAGADVFGGGVDRLAPDVVKAVLAAYPRLDFNHRFEALLLDHCRRKPLSTASTWLDAFCRNHSHGADFPSIEQGFAESPFKE